MNDYWLLLGFVSLMGLVGLFIGNLYYLDKYLAMFQLEKDKARYLRLWITSGLLMITAWIILYTNFHPFSPEYVAQNGWVFLLFSWTYSGVLGTYRSLDSPGCLDSGRASRNPSRSSMVRSSNTCMP
jgi:hypothetical protein